MVLKPSEKSPLTALRMAELALEAGLPPGVFNVVPGFGHTAGKALALHMDVDGIAFTGSTATGKLIMRMPAQSNLKRVSLECGGKSPNIVMADYPRSGARGARRGRTRSSSTRARCARPARGCWCTRASARPHAGGDREGGRASLRRAIRWIRPRGSARIVDAQQMQRVLGYIEAGRAAKARAWRSAARRCARDSGGCYVEPTVFDGVRPDMRIAREEIFGPVLATITLPRLKPRRSPSPTTRTYGLAAAVWTRDLTTAHRMARAMRAGMVYVNCYDADDITVPFGGFRAVRHGPRQVAARLRQVHRTQDHLDRPELSAAAALSLRRHGAARLGRPAGRARSPRWAGLTCARRGAGVSFEGPLEAGYRACLESRMASRVLLEVARASSAPHCRRFLRRWRAASTGASTWTRAARWPANSPASTRPSPTRISAR